VPTSGRIANGALVEREIDFDIQNMRAVQVALHNPDFTTARRIADAVNAFLGTVSILVMGMATAIRPPATATSPRSIRCSSIRAAPPATATARARTDC
jgi:flagellar basal body P-ring protein FlgI